MRKSIQEIKKEFKTKLKEEYGMRFKMKKVFDSGRFTGKGNTNQEFRNLRYEVSAQGWETRIVRLEIDYALDTFSIGT